MGKLCNCLETATKYRTNPKRNCRSATRCLLQNTKNEMLLASDSDEAARKWVAAAKSLSSNYNPINSLLFLPCNSKLYSHFTSKTTVKKTLSVHCWGQENSWCGTTVQTGTLICNMPYKRNQLTVFSLHKSFVLLSFFTLDIAQQKIHFLLQTPFYSSFHNHQRTQWNFHIHHAGKMRCECCIRFVTLMNI